MSNCILCKIVDGSIPAYTIYEDEVCIVVLDVNGAHLGHCFIIPKNHYPIVEQVPDNELGHLFVVANKVLRVLFEKIPDIQGTNIFVANGIPAGQRVAHAMVHVVPRKESDDVKLTWNPQQIPEEEMNTVELKLKDQMGDAGVEKPTLSGVSTSGESEPAAHIPDDEDDFFMHHINRIPRG